MSNKSVELASNKETIKKNSAVIQISNVITGFERQLYNHLLFLAQKSGKLKYDQTRFEASIVELVNSMEVDIRNVDYVRKAIKALVETSIEFNLLGKSSSKWEISSLLSYASIENGTVTWEYSSFIAKHLATPKPYAILSVLEMRQLDSKYTIALYELFKDYAAIKQTPEIDLKTLQKLLGVDYHDVRHFQQQVLLPALRELQQKIGMEITLKPIKRGRKIVGLKFFIDNIPPLLPERKKAKAVSEKSVKIPVNSTKQEKGQKDYDKIFTSLPKDIQNNIKILAKESLPEMFRYHENAEQFTRAERERLIDRYINEQF